jgi:hypothetical protein
MNAFFTKKHLHTYTLILALFVFFTSSRVDWYFSEKISVRQENRKDDEKQFLTEKKSDANTHEAGIKIRYVLSEIVNFSKEGFALFFSPANLKERKTVIRSLFTIPTQGVIVFLQNLFRYYISVNAP